MDGRLPEVRAMGLEDVRSGLSRLANYKEYLPTAQYLNVGPIVRALDWREGSDNFDVWFHPMTKDVAEIMPEDNGLQIQLATRVWPELRQGQWAVLYQVGKDRSRELQQKFFQGKPIYPWELHPKVDGAPMRRAFKDGLTKAYQSATSEEAKQAYKDALRTSAAIGGFAITVLGILAVGAATGAAAAVLTMDPVVICGFPTMEDPSRVHYVEITRWV